MRELVEDVDPERCDGNGNRIKQGDRVKYTVIAQHHSDVACALGNGTGVVRFVGSPGSDWYGYVKVKWDGAKIPFYAVPCRSVVVEEASAGGLAGALVKARVAVAGARDALEGVLDVLDVAGQALRQEDS